MVDSVSVRESKSEIVSAEIKRMEKNLHESKWSVKQKLALACRVLYDQGHSSGLSGQITARSGEHFITQRLGLGFNETSASNLLTVDNRLQVVDGEGMPNPANRFHTWIYKQRPEVNCIIHTHPPHTSALAMLRQPLIISHMDTCALYGEVAFLENWPGIPVADQEGEIISSALGDDKRALLLAHHGLVVVAESVELACVFAMQFELAAKLQLMASAAGVIQSIDEGLAQEAHDWVLINSRVNATFGHYARKMLEADSLCIV